jgi:hypothetical protein
MSSPLFRRKTIEHILSHASTGGAMRRSLGVRDLTAMGLAAILWAGIFSTIGNAAALINSLNSQRLSQCPHSLTAIQQPPSRSN